MGRRMILEGSSEKAAGFLADHVGDWAYDHVAANATRFGPNVPFSVWSTGSHALICDCSGILIRACVEGGMSRYHAGFPESSGTMAAWAEQRPERLLWSIHGGGKYATFEEAWDAAPRLAFVVVGDKAVGDFGHVFAKWDDQTTIESAASLNGLHFGSIDRFTGTHRPTQVLLAPMIYPGEEPVEEDFMAQASREEIDLLLHAARLIQGTVAPFVDEVKSDVPQEGPGRAHVAFFRVFRENVDHFFSQLRDSTSKAPHGGLIARLVDAFPKK